MRAWILPVLTGFTLLAACDGSSTTSGNTGGGGAGGETSTTTDGGGGSTTTDTGMTTTDPGTTTTDTGTTTTTMATDLCETAGSAPVSFANDVQPIFSQSCGSASSCHLNNNASPSAGLSLKAGEAYAELVGVDAAQACNGQKRVSPGSAADSYLVNKITATDLCPNTKKMPPSMTLPDATKQKIIDWICQGAENN